MSVKGRLVSGFCAGLLLTSGSPMRMAACKHKKIEKITGKIQEIEETLERENLNEKPRAAVVPPVLSRHSRPTRPRSTLVRCRSRL